VNGSTAWARSSFSIRSEPITVHFFHRRQTVRERDVQGANAGARVERGDKGIPVLGTKSEDAPVGK